MTHFRHARTLALMTVLCAAPMWASAQSVVSFTVVNADTGADIITVPNSTTPVTVTVNSSATPRINVRANTSGTLSVGFADAAKARIDGTAPFAYLGNMGSVYNPWSPLIGTHTIRATPFAGRSGTGTAGPTATLNVTVNSGITRNEAARFLAQATFGPTDADIDRVIALGYSAWIDEQLARPDNGAVKACYDQQTATRPGVTPYFAMLCLTTQAFWGQDQLRTRMAYALSQIFVISLNEGEVFNNAGSGAAAWVDGLGKHGFGNYRQLLEYVALNPLMGLYLSHLGNQKADTSTGRVPDENFAREIMQLFSIGVVKLNPNGSPSMGSNGQAIEAYGPADVSALARVFTGWSWACPAYPSYNCFMSGKDNGQQDPARSIKPMVAYPAYHSAEAKTFLSTPIPENTNAAESLRLALNGLAGHPNVGPFIGRQLIQRFTTSNPSPAYVEAVAKAFNNTNGVRGDMKAVLKAVLMHPEARAVTTQSGKLREPVMRLTAFVRAFPHPEASLAVTGNTFSPENALAQQPLFAPSVFNFYRPGYVAPGTASAARGLVAPEMQITTETSVAGYVNFMRDNVRLGLGSPADSGGGRWHKAAYVTELALATDARALVDHVTTRLTYGAMTQTRRDVIFNAVNAIGIPAASGTNTKAVEAAKRARVDAAIVLTLSSTDFIVLK